MSRGAAFLTVVLLAATLGSAQDTPASANASTPPVASAATSSDAPDHPPLPKTNSPLPLLGLVGLGSLAAGLIMRR